MARYTIYFIERNVAFILDTAGNASFTVNIMEEQMEGGAMWRKIGERGVSLAFLYLTVSVNNQGV